MASGITYHSVIGELIPKLAEQYQNTLRNFNVKPKQIKDMDAAFRDGMGTMIRTLVDMGVVEWGEEPKKSGE